MSKWKNVRTYLEVNPYTGQPVEEDMPTNAAGRGAVAGIGVGPDGEPGIDPKKRKKKTLIDARSKAYREHRMKLENARQRREERKSKLAQKVAENIDNFAREKYLEEVNFPSVYLLFLLNSEFKKIYNLNIGNKLNIYIPNFKIKSYDYVRTKVDSDTLTTVIEYCHSIDKSIKTGVENISLWHQLEILISCFILNKPVDKFIGKKAC